MTDSAILFFLFLLGAYGLGSLSSAIVYCRIAGLPDPRSQGSKNPGATNVLRFAGKRAAACVLIGDVLKGVLPVVLANIMGMSIDHSAMILLAAVIGHVFPLFFGFKGGKGVATAFGGIIALDLWIALAIIISWGSIAAIFRYSSLSAIISALLLPVYAWIFAPSAIWPLSVLSLIILWRHFGNIQRLIEGTETKIGQAKKAN